jgi:hypothetical protein
MNTMALDDADAKRWKLLMRRISALSAGLTSIVGVVHTLTKIPESVNTIGPYFMFFLIYGSAFCGYAIISGSLIVVAVLLLSGLVVPKTTPLDGAVWAGVVIALLVAIWQTSQIPDPAPGFWEYQAYGVLPMPLLMLVGFSYLLWAIVWAIGYLIDAVKALVPGE